MPVVVGGLRARLIRDSIYNAIYAGLDALGWFDEGRKHTPINFTGKIVDQDEEIPLNTIVLVDEDIMESEIELGSNLAEHDWTFYVDFYAENAGIGRELINDVRDILAGRMSSIGRSHPSVIVFDYREPTPPALFKVHIEDIVIDRATGFPKPWQKHWYSCRFSVIDHYGDESLDEYGDVVYEP